ncbi:hypothetical protein RM780_15840 [Streptomyces sp. DSM 44917]|uniref:Uncharacterized protein n=1 Tax=Streptomyces boetiae TaxID=3075541 RepID=A0ABU2LA17_9ACTN|nr:hypothetical protein [Streptomyces sp. DSM 44917]MDT0308421.1 hypothetical protein [Streptomyces sp. DSM 44917]
MSTATTLWIQVVGAADADAAEVHELALGLRRLLLEETEARDVAFAEEPAPEGSRSGTALALGTLAVALAPAVLRPALRVLETWLENRPDGGVTVTLGDRSIELGHARREERERLIAAFLEAAGPAPDPDPDPDPGDPAATD